MSKCSVCDEQMRRSISGICTRNAECTKANKASEYQRHRESYDARNRQWINANLTRRREISSEWQSRNLDVARRVQSDRRARLARLFVESVDYDTVFERDSGVCHLCNAQVDAMDWHLDHVISIDDSGTHEYDNVAVSHQSCNQSKNRESRSANPRVWERATKAYERFHGVQY